MTGILAAAAVFIALVVGGAYLVAGPADSDDVLHRLTGQQVEHAAQVGSTVVLEHDGGQMSLLDLESGDVRRTTADVTAPWAAGRGGEVAFVAHTRDGGTSGFGVDGSLLWSSSAGADVLAVLDDGTTVLRDCAVERCDVWAVEPDGTERWSQSLLQWRIERLAWLDGSDWAWTPPDRALVRTRESVVDDEGDIREDTEEDRASAEVQLLDPETGEGTTVGTGYAALVGDAVVLIDTTQGACDLTILRDPDEAGTELADACPGVRGEPELLVAGDNLIIRDEEESTEVLVPIGADTLVTPPEDLEDVELSAAGLVGRDESGWAFGTNGDGTLTQHFDGDARLAATGQDTIAFTTDLSSWNPFSGGLVRHHILDPVTGETCARVDATAEGSVVALPGCRAIVNDPSEGTAVLVGRATPSEEAVG